MTVAALEWLDPVFVAGHWTPQLIELAGGTDVLGLPGEPSRAGDVGDGRRRASRTSSSSCRAATTRRARSRRPRRYAERAARRSARGGSSRSTPPPTFSRPGPAARRRPRDARPRPAPARGAARRRAPALEALGPDDPEPGDRRRGDGELRADDRRRSRRPAQAGPADPRADGARSPAATARPPDQRRRSRPPTCPPTETFEEHEAEHEVEARSASPMSVWNGLTPRAEQDRRRGAHQAEDRARGADGQRVGSNSSAPNEPPSSDVK